MKNSHIWESIVLSYLTVTSAFAGAWALFFPAAFYDFFPGFGLKWVSVDGPFNEHFIRDVGALQLALALLAMISLAARYHASVRTVALCTLMFTLPHFLYHMVHFHVFSSLFDQIANVVVLGNGVLMPLLLLYISSAKRKAQRAKAP